MTENSKYILNNKELMKKWKSYSNEFRIEATIHDGQWYNKKKWLSVAKIKDEAILDDWIDKHKDILIISKDSYRVGCEEVLRWYVENDIDITESIIPKNYPPRIWDNKTETEGLLNAPREWASSVLATPNNTKVREKIIEVCSPYSMIKVADNNKIYIYTYSSEFLKEKLLRALTPEEYTSAKIRIRNFFKRRETIDLSEEFLIRMLDFYLAYSVNILRPHQKTMEIFLPEQGDRKTQIYEWIINAIQKFDETEPVPFSGYLASVLNRWPYDLPDFKLGKPVATYQRRRAKALEKLKLKLETEYIPIEELRKELDTYTDEEFSYYENLNDQWVKLQSVSALAWDEKQEEKPGKNITENSNITEEELMVKHKIIKSILSAAIKTNSEQEAFYLLQNLHSDDFSDFNNINDNYKKQLFKDLKLNH